MISGIVLPSGAGSTAACVLLLVFLAALATSCEPERASVRHLNRWGGVYDGSGGVRSEQMSLFRVTRLPRSAKWNAR
jgi:hypothetical protein